MKKIFVRLKFALIILFAPALYTFRDRIADLLEQRFTLSVVFPRITGLYPMGFSYQIKILQSSTCANMEKVVNEYILSLNGEISKVINSVSIVSEPGNGEMTTLLIIQIGTPA